MGSVFIEFEDIKQAEYCMKQLRGRRYDKRDIKAVFIDTDVFNEELKPVEDKIEK